MNQDEQSKQMSQVVARCWADETFKQKLLADPAAALEAEGVQLPKELLVRPLEDTDKVFHFVIPARPAELPDDLLEKLAAGGAISANCYRDGKLLA